MSIAAGPSPVTLPDRSRYWNPGPETKPEALKLSVLHKVSQAGGVCRRLFGTLAADSIGILTYHRISEVFPGIPAPTINVTPEHFRQQLTGLLHEGFRFSPLSEVLDAAESGRSIESSTIVLTFDDIYDNVYDQAFPILTELGIPATCFISTAFIDSSLPFLFDAWALDFQEHIPKSSWRPVTWKHLKEMNDSGLIELGAHTDTHQDFRNTPDQFSTDLGRGVERLEEITGEPPTTFAFPYGSPQLGFSNDSLMQIVRQLGLRCGLTTGSHTNRTSAPPFGWGRFHVFDHDTPTSLAGKLSGWYEWLPRVRNRIIKRS